LHEPLPWPNSTLVRDVPAGVERLKGELDGDLLVMGSGDLIRTLMQHDLIDEYLLVIHPLVLGTGGKLFAEGSPKTTFGLVDVTPTTTGAVILTYRPAR
jgi:dihydrofolate reductase